MQLFKFIENFPHAFKSNLWNQFRVSRIETYMCGNFSHIQNAAIEKFTTTIRSFAYHVLFMCFGWIFKKISALNIGKIREISPIRIRRFSQARNRIMTGFSILWRVFRYCDQFFLSGKFSAHFSVLYTKWNIWLRPNRDIQTHKSTDAENLLEEIDKYFSDV